MDRQQILKDIVTIMINGNLIKDDAEIALDSYLNADLGIGSLDSVELIMAIEDHYDIEVDDDLAIKVTTVGEMVDLLFNQLSEAG